MKARHFLQVTSEIIGKHRHPPQGLIESKTEVGFHTQACTGDQLPDQESFEYRPTQEEMEALALEGASLLFIDCLKGK
jgi:hypothetical protein